jgi:hypothetical protein
MIFSEKKAQLHISQVHEGLEGKQRGIDLLFFDLSSRSGWVVNTTPQPL